MGPVEHCRNPIQDHSDPRSGALLDLPAERPKKRLSMSRHLTLAGTGSVKMARNVARCFRFIGE